MGKYVTKIKLPAILGWLITGIVFGPYLVRLVSAETLETNWYQIVVKIFEGCAGVMIGREILFKKAARSGMRVVGITCVQSLGTFLFVSLAFAVTFAIADMPLYPAFIFGGIALATAPAPALSIVNEYKTRGPVTQTLIPLAAIDDVIGVIVFFTVISIAGAVKGGASVSALTVVGMIFLPFVIGIAFGALVGLLVRKIKNVVACFILYLLGLSLCVTAGLCIDCFVFGAFRLNDLLIGMAFGATVANFADQEKSARMMRMYDPVLNIALVVVIVNLGMPLDYRLIAGAGVFTAVYILSRAIGKIGGSFLGCKITKAEPTVTKYLGLTLLPHSGVSLVFTGIAVNTLSSIDAAAASVLSGTIVAAAILNEIIAVLLAKVAFKMAGEIPPQKPTEQPPTEVDTAV